MQLKNGKYYYSPSDLTRYMDSPFASWMDRFNLEYPDQIEKDPADELMQTLATKGYEHEDAVENNFITQGVSIVKIKGKSATEKYKNTIEAMKNGVDVIMQARLELGNFGGYADFIVKVEHQQNQKPSKLGNYHYEVWDAKLANKIKPTFVIQLCCYTEMLEAIQGCKSEFITIVLGNKENKRLKTNDFFYSYKNIQASFLANQNSFDINNKPDFADSKNWGNWSNYAKKLQLETDHLSQTARITKAQIKKLNQAGIKTMQQLVDLPQQNIYGINNLVLNKLKAQAKIQKLSAGDDTPKFEIIKPEQDARFGLALLPPHSKLDIFFDIEGFPLDDGGLEYLWGSTYFNENGNREFKDFWAHNQQQEKQAFSSFITWAYQLWQQDKTMHIYHYAHYEVSVCKRLMGRYGVCEHEVDELLRNEVFIDLYKIVKEGLLLGEPSYSIKNVELLYRGKRDTAVGSGSDSVVVYDNWRTLNQLGKEGDSWQSSNILNDIRDYNIDDCNSTQELVDWLRKQQEINKIAYIDKPEKAKAEIKEEITARIKLRNKLLKRALSEQKTNPEQAQLTENLAWMLEFHRREAKPVFWRLFERLGLSHEELIDDLDCLAYCERTELKPFKPTANARILAYEYCFDSTQEFKGAKKQFYLLGIKTADDKNATVTFASEASNLKHGIIALQSKDEPPAIITLIPNEYVNPYPIPEAIDKIVKDYASGALMTGKSAIIDFLTRSKPRIKHHHGGDIVSSKNSQERLQQIIAVIKNLDNSYLTIQGPPGSGKSYTGKHVIAELVKLGYKVGITSNSHKVINNLLLSTAKYCQAENIKASFCCTKKEAELDKYNIAVYKNPKLAGQIKPRCVVGTTAWGFARKDMLNKLDYLFIDEAGQVSVANLLAMSGSATNLILMGDQMQLGQPTQAIHPAESGLSVLDYLLHETPTIATDMGVFLSTTYRMHSKINSFISEHIYDGKLDAHLNNDKRIIEVPDNYVGPLNMEAGIVFIPVEHQGNTQASDEEVTEIKKLANSLIGRQFKTGKNSESKKITLEDMLFVAPYNHQVSKLQAALGEQAKVGSVDKFQGQEAPIVFLSMCASDASESPRGLDFLFNKNRINVAVSRAISLAIVVANPNIAETAITQVAKLKLINLFIALTKTKAS